MPRRWLAGFLILLLPALVHAQDDDFERVRFESSDGVNLRGTFYRGKGRTPPVALLLHDIGRQGSDWHAFALALQKAGYAALAFDFRGHGDSTEVEQEFWNPKYLARGLVRSNSASSISYKNFDARYLSCLVNDIAAAKALLDRRNDQGSCDTSNLIVIGVGQGATLGALWINAESYRFELMPSPMLGFPPQVSQSPESDKILGAIFVDLDDRLGNRRVNVPALLDVPARKGRVPLVFLQGERDPLRQRLSALVAAWKKEQDLPFTFARTIVGSGQRTGMQLLDDRLGTDRAVIEYLKELHDDRANEWEEQNVQDSFFVWRLPHAWNNPIPANRMGDKAPLFNSYTAFLR